MGREPPVAREGPSSTALYTAAWLALGAGAATGVATVVSWKHLSDADSALYERVTRGTDDRQDALNNELDQERRRQLVRTWAFGVGTVLLLGAGASLLVLDAGGGSDLSFDIGGDFHGLRYHGAF
jgi:hypothetical protein